MAGLGIIATGAAFLNYRNAKAEYDALVEKKEGLEAAIKQIASAIDTYNQHKYDDQTKPDYANINADSIDTGANELPEGVQITAMLRVANLVGKLFYAKPSLVLLNNSQNTYYIQSVQLDCEVVGSPVVLYKKSLKEAVRETDIVNAEQELKPNEVLEIELPTGISSLGDKMGELRSLVCNACGKRLITSCGKTNIEDAIKADFILRWSLNKRKDWTYDKNKGQWVGDNKGWRIGLPGVLRYCMEAGLK